MPNTVYWNLWRLVCRQSLFSLNAGILTYLDFLLTRLSIPVSQTPSVLFWFTACWLSWSNSCNLISFSISIFFILKHFEFFFVSSRLCRVFFSPSFFNHFCSYRSSNFSHSSRSLTSFSPPGLPTSFSLSWLLISYSSQIVLNLLLQIRSLDQSILIRMTIAQWLNQILYCSSM